MYSEDDPAPPIALKWAFLLRTGEDAAAVLDFKDPPTVTAGDALQIYIHPVSPVYVYFYLLDSGGQLHVILPQGGRSKGPLRSEVFLPAENRAFLFDDSPGTETFYFMASAERIADLEELSSRLSQTPGSKELGGALLEKLKDLRRRFGGFAIAPGKAITIAGTVGSRGAQSELYENATLVTAEGFYATTLRLSHE